MSKNLFRELERRLNDHSYMSGINRSRERVRATAEIFTPTALVITFIEALPKNALIPEKLVLDPACGDGQFLAAVKWYRVLKFDIREEEAVKTIFGVDLMRDNVDLCKKRLGGGTILMGDALNPSKRLANQTQDEYRQLNEILDNDTQLTLFI